MPEKLIMVRESTYRDLREALESFVTYGCPVCGGDCASANPPVYGCPMQADHAVLAKAVLYDAAPDNAGRGADLVNVPERFVRWMNIYPNVGGRLYASKDGAERNRSYQSAGLLKLTYENDRLVAVELVEGGDA